MSRIPSMTSARSQTVVAHSMSVSETSSEDLANFTCSRYSRARAATLKRADSGLARLPVAQDAEDALDGRALHGIMHRGEGFPQVLLAEV